MKPLLSVVIAGVCAATLHTGAVQADEVKVAVAANFKGTIDRIGKEFTAKTGHTLAISSAATGVLYTQISHGAPFDLFLSADAATPEKLEKEGKGSDRFTYAIGQLGLWKKGGPAPDEATLRSWKGNLAIANARTAPYGAAAMATLPHLKIDPKLPVADRRQHRPDLAICRHWQCRAGLCRLGQPGGSGQERRSLGRTG